MALPHSARHRYHSAGMGTLMTWCWLRHAWSPWMWFGNEGLEVRSCLVCRTLQWRGGVIPLDLLKAVRNEEPKGC